MDVAASPDAGAIIVAAGRGQRMGGVNKALLTLHGEPVLHYSLRVLGAHPRIGAIVVVAPAEGFDAVRDIVAASQIATPWHMAVGGARRQDSVAAGLRQLPAAMTLVVVHDAARPFLDPAMVSAGLDLAAADGAAVTGIPSCDTAKLVGPDGLVRETIERSLLWLIQTPQVFQRERLEWAFQQSDEDVTDEATMLERLGLPVRVYPGSVDNIKVTVPHDMPVAETIARERRTA